MGNLKINGSTEFMGMELPIIEGGFGEDKRAMLVRDIAKLHKRQMKHINENISSNRKRFKDGVDIIDLKSVGGIDRDLLMRVGFSNSSISNSKHIYILSERGYSKLIKIMDDEKSWEVHDELIDHYFALRKKVRELITEQDLAILKIINSDSDIEQALAVKEFQDLLVKPLEEEINRYSRFLCDEMSTLSKTGLASRLDTKPQTLAVLFKRLGIYTPTSQVSVDFLNRFPDTKMIVESISEFTNPKTGKIISKNDWIWTGEGAKELVDYLIELDKVTFTENKGFKLKNNKKI